MYGKNHHNIVKNYPPIKVNKLIKNEELNDPDNHADVITHLKPDILRVWSQVDLKELLLQTKLMEVIEF